MFARFLMVNFGLNVIKIEKGKKKRAQLSHQAIERVDFFT
jgi:hypothetical protein